ncbi:hypothetical protein Tcan_00844, partial [Toxocara canis]
MFSDFTSTIQHSLIGYFFISSCLLQTSALLFCSYGSLAARYKSIFGSFTPATARYWQLKAEIVVVLREKGRMARMTTYEGNRISYTNAHNAWPIQPIRKRAEQTMQHVDIPSQTF